MADEIRKAVQAPAVNNAGSLLDQLKEMKEHGAPDLSEEVALAAAVVLMEVAGSDHSIDKFERSIIQAGLRSLFPLSEAAINRIMGTAKNHLLNMRGSSSEAAILKQALDPASRRALAKTIDDLINAHGEPEGFEIYLRRRFRTALGLPDEVLPTT